MVLMLDVFSLRIASLPEMLEVAPMIWRMVDSRRERLVCPLVASSAVCSETPATSPIVLPSSLVVAEISLAVLPISSEVEATSLALACCSLSVAAISVALPLTWMSASMRFFNALASA